MARKPRHEEAGAIHHVYARGVERRLIFLSDDDRHIYLEVLDLVVEETRWRCLAYCLMPNHVHLLIETPTPNLGVGMQRLHGLYAQDFNDRYGRVGHLFQGRYGSSRIRTDAQLASIVEYISLNAVRAGLSADPKGWPWSSTAALASGSPPAWLAARRLDDLTAEGLMGAAGFEQATSRV